MRPGSVQRGIVILWCVCLLTALSSEAGVKVKKAPEGPKKNIHVAMDPDSNRGLIVWESDGAIYATVAKPKKKNPQKYKAGRVFKISPDDDRRHHRPYAMYYRFTGQWVVAWDTGPDDLEEWVLGRESFSGSSDILMQTLKLKNGKKKGPLSVAVSDGQVNLAPFLFVPLAEFSAADDVRDFIVGWTDTPIASAAPSGAGMTSDINIGVGAPKGTKLSTKKHADIAGQIGLGVQRSLGPHNLQSLVNAHITRDVGNLGLVVGFNIITTSTEDDNEPVEEREPIRFAFEAGLKVEYHFTDFFSVHTEVGFVFALINRAAEANALIGTSFNQSGDGLRTTADGKGGNTRLQGVDVDGNPTGEPEAGPVVIFGMADSFGNAGFTFWFNSPPVGLAYDTADLDTAAMQDDIILLGAAKNHVKAWSLDPTDINLDREVTLFRHKGEITELCGAVIPNTTLMLTVWKRSIGENNDELQVEVDSLTP